MTRASFFQPRRCKDEEKEAKKPVQVRSAPESHAEPLRDEGGARIWSQRSLREEKSLKSPGNYRFGAPEPSLSVLQERLSEAIQEEEILRERLRELEHQLAQACGTEGQDYSHRKQRHKGRVDELTAAVRQLQLQRAAILEGTDPEVHSEQRKRDELKRFKTSGGYSTEAEIDERIESLEQKMYEMTMELLQEKRALAEIQSLQRQKEEVREHRLRAQSLRTDQDIIRGRLDEVGGSLKAKLKELQVANDELKALEEERQAILKDSPLVAERAEAHYRLNECLRLRAQLERSTARGLAKEREEREAKQREEARRQREEARRRQEEERRRREEEQEEARRRVREERAERLKQERQERRRQQEEEFKLNLPQVPQVTGVPDLPKEPPGSAEMRLLEQTLAYCQKLLPQSNEATDEKKPVEYNNPEGSLIIVPKEDRSEEYLFPPPKPRRHEGKVNRRPPTSKLRKSHLSQQVLMHTPLSLRLFEELRIVPPVNTSDVPATVDEVEERLVRHRKAAHLWEIKRQEILEQKLQNELNKVREAQEERERERKRRLNMALHWLEDFEEEVTEDDFEDSRQSMRLQDLVMAAKSMGATAQQLSRFQQLLERWRAKDAEVRLANAISQMEEVESDDKTLLRQARQELADALAAEDVDPELMLRARDLLEARREAQDEEGSPDSPSSSSHGQSEVEVNQGAVEEERSSLEDFVPLILNPDDDEELVFDLGMG